MSDIDIIKQLLSGNHLEPKELDRANVLLQQLIIGLKSRIKG